ncbi:MAG: branched-chain amino acid ABC transporter permease [Burkholderiales bacterium]|jgi:branched-chain amino acid transport system permease protein|nr:branched-chain amino acid ABC transporter permease [Burkholderiales bacterium]
MRSDRTATVLGIVLLLVLVALPFFAGKYYVQLATKIMIMAVFAMSLDLLVGYAGLVSLGHAAFYGLGAYLVALAAPQYQAANFWTSLPLAVGGAALLAAAIGFFAVRTQGIYFIMVTLAFAQMVYFVFHDTKIAGGSDGIFIDVRPDAKIAGWTPFDLADFVQLYFVVLVAFVAVYVLLRVVLRSLFGRVVQGIRVNEHRMKSLGYSTFRYKLAAFILAGALAGLAGYFGAVQYGAVNPEMLGWHLSGSVLMMVILGGMGTLTGAVVGATAFLLLELLFQSLTEHWQLLMGGTIVLVALFLPHGIAGLARPLFGRKDG